jgi:hypothetical protein
MLLGNSFEQITQEQENGTGKIKVNDVLTEGSFLNGALLLFEISDESQSLRLVKKIFDGLKRKPSDSTCRPIGHPHV